ncbi:MAG TPA: M15 family metallopeptidase [Bacteroidales bacterium]|nr:M15 family metallopeptidase [Bacteroidales bacterium]
MATWDPITDKRIALLHPKIREDVEWIINTVEDELEIRLRVTQGLRTFAEQDALFNQPRDGKDNDGDGRIDEADEKVTNARAGDSYHNYGLAFDVVEILRGQANWNTKYRDIAAIAARKGFDWGGNFKTLVDRPHFQKTFGYSIAKLKQTRKQGNYPVIQTP